jgi:hypothetical protein
MSIYLKNWVSNIKRERQCYFILLQSISKVLCSLVTDFIAIEVQCGECLGEVMNEKYKERMRLLLYFVANHLQDVVLLGHRFD